MTGFARSAGAIADFHWQWEVKCVNGKSLDVRSRLPPGFESLDLSIRASVAEKVKRGSVQASLSVSGASQGGRIVVNEAVLDRILAAGERLRERIGGETLRADAILAMRGVVEFVEEPEDEALAEERRRAVLASLAEAVIHLDATRRAEGARLATIAMGLLDRIEALTAEARDNPSRSPEAIKARIGEQVRRLLDTAAALDTDRLHQEAVLLAARADIQEEIDRLFAHVAAGRDLLATGDAVGRRFDFLAQEFNREANTLCSKSADRSLTRTGLALKTAIDQLREQVQNIE